MEGMVSRLLIKLNFGHNISLAPHEGSNTLILYQLETYLDNSPNLYYKDSHPYVVDQVLKNEHMM